MPTPDMFKKDHPERQDDELYLGNFEMKHFHLIGWKTKRNGSVAYDIEGNVISDCLCPLSPVFVKRSEVDARDPAITKKLLPSSEMVAQ